MLFVKLSFVEISCDNLCQSGLYYPISCELEKLVMEEEDYHFTAVVRHRLQGLILRLPLVLSRSYSKFDFTLKLPLSNYSSEIYY